MVGCDAGLSVRQVITPVKRSDFTTNPSTLGPVASFRSGTASNAGRRPGDADDDFGGSEELSLARCLVQDKILFVNIFDAFKCFAIR